MRTCCPNCFGTLTEELYAFRCGNGACTQEVDERLKATTGREQHLGLVTPLQPALLPGWRREAGGRCSACTQPAVAEVCPSCHYALLPGLRDHTTTCLALAGARSSGKTIYIATLVKQMMQWCERHGQALTPADPATGESYGRTYEAPLFHKRQLVPPTASVQTRDGAQRNEPLVWQMGLVNGRPHLLVLRDVAGEDLENPSSPLEPFAFFRGADAVLFLFDPARLEEIKTQLAGVLPQQRMDGGDPVQVLQNLVRLIRGGTVLSTERLPTRFALVLAKFDVLAELAQIPGSPHASIMDNPGAAFNREPAWQPAYDVNDGQLLQAEVESLLQRLGAVALLNVVRQSFADHQTFAVSALGALPFSSESVNPHGIAPFRVLDPAMWAMAKAGDLPVVYGAASAHT